MQYVTELIERQNVAEKAQAEANEQAIQAQVQRWIEEAKKILQPFMADFKPYLVEKGYILTDSGNRLESVNWQVDAPDMSFYIAYEGSAGERGHIFFSHKAPGTHRYRYDRCQVLFDADGAIYPGVVQFLRQAKDNKAKVEEEREKARIEELDRTITRHCMALTDFWACRNTDEAKAEQTLAKLIHLAPDRADEWQAMFEKWQVGRNDYLAKEAQKAAEAAQTKQNERAFVGAYLAHQKACQEIVMNNRERLAGVQDKLNQEYMLYKLCYALTWCDDGDYEQTGTDWVYVLDAEPMEGGFWREVRQGHVVHARYYNLVSLEGPFKMKPSDNTNDAGRLSIPEAGLMLYFPPEWDAEQVSKMIPELTPFPQKPSPQDYDVSISNEWHLEELLARYS